MNKKYSRQREAIRTELCSRCDHPTADDIYQKLREEYPNISLGTVYRNLAGMANNGEILRIYGEEGPDRFDADIRPHYHYRCTSCGSVRDVFIEVDNTLSAVAAAESGENVKGHSVVFFGECANCSGGKNVQGMLAKTK